MKGCKRFLSPALLFLGGFLALRGQAAAATAREAGFAVETYLGGLGTVTALAFAPDGTLFIAEKNGLLRVFPYGAGSAQTFASLPVYTNSECGLLGVALDPGYTGYGTGGSVYVFATLSAGEQRIIRFRDAGGVGKERADIKTGLPTLGVNHDGGCLRVGPDGKLYFAIGEGGSGSLKSQDVTLLFGKVMRLNLDGSIPSDNPDLSAINPAYRREIFAYGFRNPFRIAVRPTGPGPQDFQLFVNDVGSAGDARREEVNLVQPGKNYGWPLVEGIASDPRFVNPIHAYNLEGNAIVGGVFYGGRLFPADYRGNYFFMDYGSSKVFRMVLDGDQKASIAGNPHIFVDGEGGPIDLAEGPDGALYYSTAVGTIYRIRYETPGNKRPVVALIATPAAGKAPFKVELDAGQSADPDGQVVRYDWSFGDGSWLLDGGPKTTHLYGRQGLFTARVVVTDDSGGVSAATTPIDATLVDLPPLPEILTPDAGSSYDAGVAVQFSGRASDPEDGEVPPERLSWEVVLHHNDHTHPFVTGETGGSGSFQIPSAGLEENWSFEIVLHAADSQGVSASASRTVYLNYVPLDLSSDPSGLRLTADGVSLTTPARYNGVNGARVELAAPSPQNLAPAGGPVEGRYVWGSWSDGGAADHEVVAASGLAVGAVFVPDPKAIFIRGDSNRDGAVDVSDAIYTLNVLFTGGPFWPCPEAADANDDGQLDIADPVATLVSLFNGGRVLPAPGPTAGFDPTPDGLGCES